MLTALFSAISGLNANGLSLSVIGDNVANMNTVGYKASRIAFGDVLSQTITGAAGGSQVGRGVLVSDVSPLFTQGSFETTSSALDMAIDGEGFFIVSDGLGRYYSRAGQFALDENGRIVNPDGFALQGYAADSSGNITGTVGDITVSSQASAANATSSADVVVNLDARADIVSTAFTLDGNGDGTNDDPANFSYTTQLTVYDSQGSSHDVTAYYVKTADNTWEAHYVYEDPANAGQYLEAGTQDISFGTDGELIDDNSSTAISFDFGTAVTSPQDVTFDYGTGTGETPAGTGFDGTTQFSSEFAVMNLSQDGYASGSLKNLNIEQDGTITGVFTNGQTRVIGQIALAKFAAPTELTKLGGNLYAESYNSGQAIISGADSGGLGRVLSNTLELSNVDLAEEFIKMISSQRGFQANSRIITTTDDLLQELVNLKR